MPRFVPWLIERKPDVVCLQETKLTDDAFDALVHNALTDLGYEYAHHGQGRWNGVAIVSRVGLTDVQRGLANEPGFPDPATLEARAITATCNDIRIACVYVPNGREPDDPHYHYKLAWLRALTAHTSTLGSTAIVCGDINIAPTDADVFDAAMFEGHTHVTQPERGALADLMSRGLRDVVRDTWPDERVFSFWDYRAGMFHQDLGMRIDLVLATSPVADRVAAAWIDRGARKGTSPSDHAPVVVDLDTAYDGAIGPVVPPPSQPPGRSRRPPRRR